MQSSSVFPVARLLYKDFFFSVESLKGEGVGAGTCDPLLAEQIAYNAPVWLQNKDISYCQELGSCNS